MKKIVAIFVSAMALTATAQLRVLENGQVIAGQETDFSPSSNATLVLFDREANGGSPSDYSNKGSLSFGYGSACKISGSGASGGLDISSLCAINFTLSDYKSVFSIVGPSHTITSLYDMKAPSFLTTSDARLKNNVESLNEVYRNLQDVNAVSYNLAGYSTKESTTKEATINAAEAISEEFPEDTRTRFGFIAQDIQKIFPNLVVEDEEGMLAIDYTGFIPLLVEAYKDLSNKVKEQEEIIFEMGREIKPYNMPVSVNEIMDNKVVLKQNRPNPFNTATTIECFIPETVSNAFLCIYDLQGQQVMRIDIAERGTVNSVIEASSMRPGMYIYSLIADGTEVDSKRMIITD